MRRVFQVVRIFSAAHLWASQPLWCPERCCHIWTSFNSFSSYVPLLLSRVKQCLSDFNLLFVQRVFFVEVLHHVLLHNSTVYTCKQTNESSPSSVSHLLCGLMTVRTARPTCSHMQRVPASHWLDGEWWLCRTACLGGPVCVLFWIITGAVWAEGDWGIDSMTAHP